MKLTGGGEDLFGTPRLVVMKRVIQCHDWFIVDNVTGRKKEERGGNVNGKEAKEKRSRVAFVEHPGGDTREFLLSQYPAIIYDAIREQHRDPI
jgi:hypothetical protein